MTALYRKTALALIAVAVSASTASVIQARADGAIAIGLPADVAKKGVAVGTSWGYPTVEAAEARALKECLAFMDAPPDTRALCKVVQTFKDQCFVVALDPKNGTPGFGWAVRPTMSAAEEAAME
jgi:Domain of unknown function (DUF4189)